MNDRPSSGPAKSGWRKRIRQLLTGKPQDRLQLNNLLRDSEKRNLIDSDALAMIEGVLEVAEMQVRDVMIPRSQMVAVERDATLEELLPIIVESGHSRFPVIGDNKDEVEGTVLAKSLLPYFIDGREQKFDIRDIMLPPVFIPESKRLNVLLKEFRTGRNHMAIVVDEYGGVAGLVTIEDVLEQIVGDIVAEHGLGEDTFIMQFNQNEYTVKALTPIEEFNDSFGTDYNDDEFDTIGGFVMQAMGHLPRRGETLTLGDFMFRVLRADNRRIYLLHVTRLKAPSQEQRLAAGQE